MDANKVDLYLATNQKYFPPEKILFLKEKLLAADDNKFLVASAVELKDPTMMLLVSIFAGGFGIDRFLLGEIGIGVLKLLTGGVCGILALVDIFIISKKAREKNFIEIMRML